MKKVIILLLVFGIVLNLMGQEKINLETLNCDQLNLYKEKAVKMKTSGVILLCAGTGALLTGTLIA